jgi:hypothetical protein
VSKDKSKDNGKKDSEKVNLHDAVIVDVQPTSEKLLATLKRSRYSKIQNQRDSDHESEFKIDVRS